MRAELVTAPLRAAGWTKVELKSINSFKYVKDAIEYESNGRLKY